MIIDTGQSMWNCKSCGWVNNGATRCSNCSVNKSAEPKNVASIIESDFARKLSRDLKSGRAHSHRSLNSASNTMTHPDGTPWG